MVTSQDGQGRPGVGECLQRFLDGSERGDASCRRIRSSPEYERADADLAARHRDHMRQLDRHSQQLLVSSPDQRQRVHADVWTLRRWRPTNVASSRTANTSTMK